MNATNTCEYIMIKEIFSFISRNQYVKLNNEVERWAKFRGDCSEQSNIR